MLALVTLALGIGASTTIFSVVNSVLPRPLPYETPGIPASVWIATMIDPTPSTAAEVGV